MRNNVMKEDAKFVIWKQLANLNSQQSGTGIQTIIRIKGIGFQMFGVSKNESQKKLFNKSGLILT